jgi:hypothetical protein
MIKCKTYLLTRPEMEAAKKFLDENQAMGYIEPTNSPYSSPFFFIKKKDGTLRPVQDYREINKWTICDIYPIPQITHIATVGRTCYHVCIHMAILRVCDTRALDAADRDALTVRYGLLFMGSLAFYLYDTRCVVGYALCCGLCTRKAARDDIV